MDLEGLLRVSSTSASASTTSSATATLPLANMDVGVDRNASSSTALGDAERLLAVNVPTGIDLAKHPSGIVPVLQYSLPHGGFRGW